MPRVSLPQRLRTVFRATQQGWVKCFHVLVIYAFQYRKNRHPRQLLPEMSIVVGYNRMRSLESSGSPKRQEVMRGFHYGALVTGNKKRCRRTLNAVLGSNNFEDAGLRRLVIISTRRQSDRAQRRGAGKGTSPLINDDIMWALLTGSW